MTSVLKIRPGCECTDFGFVALGTHLAWAKPLHFWAPWARYFTQRSAGGHCKTPVGCDESQLPPTSGGCFSQKLSFEVVEIPDWSFIGYWVLTSVDQYYDDSFGSSLSSVCRFSCWRCGRKDIFDLIQYKCIIQMIYCMFAYLRSLLYMSDTLRRWLYLQGTKHKKWFIMLLLPSYQHPPDRTTAARGSGRSDLRGFTHHAFLKSKVLFRKLLGM